MRDASGAVLRTPDLIYAGDEGKALARGASRGDFPIQTEVGKPKQVAHLAWDDACLLTFWRTTCATNWRSNRPT